MSSEFIQQPLWSNKLTALVFVLLISLPILVSVVTSDEKISILEKRVMATMPEFSLMFSDLAEFRRRTEAYVSDHIGFRDAAISLNGAIKIVLFSVSPNIWVLVGKNKWLYYWGPNSIDYTPELNFQGVYRYRLRDLDNWYVSHLALLDDLNRQGIQYKMMIVPNKQSVYPEYLPYKIRQKAGKTVLDQFAGYLEDKNIPEFHDLRAELTALKPKGMVYWRTDSHWSHLGFVHTYRKIMRWARTHYPEISPAKTDDMFELESLIAVGDLVGMIGYVDYFNEDAILLTQRSSCASRDGEVSMEKYGNGQMASLYKCDTGNRKLLFIHDSFGALALPLMTQHFANTMSVENGTPLELRQLISDFSPDLVVFLRVERELPTVFPYQEELVNHYLETSFEKTAGQAKQLELSPASLNCLNCRLQTSPGGLEIHAETNDPYVVFNTDRIKHINKSITLKIVISHNRPDRLAVFFTTDNSDTYSKDKAALIYVKQGINTIYLRIPTDSPLAQLRIDPGEEKETFILNEVSYQ